MARRYEFGPDLGPIVVTSQPGEPPADPGTPRTDLAAPTVVSVAPESVTLAFVAYDPATTNAPAEVFAALAPDGYAWPADATSTINDSNIARASSTAPIPPEGDPAYVVPHPTVPQGNYIGKVILAFDDPE